MAYIDYICYNERASYSFPYPLFIKSSNTQFISATARDPISQNRPNIPSYGIYSQISFESGLSFLRGGVSERSVDEQNGGNGQR